MGWKLGTEFSEEKSAISSCFAINKNNVQLCEEDRFNLYDDFELLNSMNEMKNREIGIFINDGTVDKNNKMEIKLFDDKYTNSISDDGFGMIEYVNDEKILDDKLVNVDTPLVTITGWISYDEKIIDSVYVLSNKEIISKILNFEETNEKDQYSKEKYFWSTKILTSYLENECNEISFVGIQNENKITINEKITICKKN